MRSSRMKVLLAARPGAARRRPEAWLKEPRPIRSSVVWLAGALVSTWDRGASARRRNKSYFYRKKGLHIAPA